MFQLDAQAVDLDAAVAAYRKERFALLPAILNNEQVAQLLASTAELPEIRPAGENSEGDVMWSEKRPKPGSEALSFFADPVLSALAHRLSGLSVVEWIQSWVSIYRDGERIGSHTDFCGSIQLLICLQAPPGPEWGGILQLGDTAVFLKAGDGVAFEATTVQHRTTTMARDTRIVIVGRYFMR